MNARSSHALAALPLLAAGLIASSAVAQEVTPPAVVATQAAPTASAPQRVAPPPVVATAPATPSDGSSATAIDAQAAANAAAEQAERRPARRTARTSGPSRAAAPARTRVAAVVPAATTPAPAEEVPAPATTPAPTQAAPATPVASEEPAPTAAAEPARDRSIWPWVVAALVVVGIAAGLVMWRRRRAREEVWQETAYTTEPVHAEPVQPEPAPQTWEPARAPVAAAAAVPAVSGSDPATAAPAHDAPIATVEEASVARADADDVEALTAAAPVGDRPWLELAMRPVRAGTTDDEARVEIELTVGNAGAVDAEEVHVSAFMLADPDDGVVERMLVNPPAADAVEPLRIGAGEGTRVDIALTLPRASLASEARFRPVVIAEARYRLPNGEEGRTAASFDVGMVGDPDAPLAPVTTAGTEMRDDVEARLHRAAEHV